MEESCDRLYKAAVKGNWKEAKEIIQRDYSMLEMRVTHGEYTALHVAAGAPHVYFVKKLMKMTAKKGFDLVRLLRLRDGKGNTAFCLAAAAGSLEIIETMLAKDPGLTDIRNGVLCDGKTPLYTATLFGHEKLACYLYKRTVHKTDGSENLFEVFFSCITTGLYGLAVEILRGNEIFALQREHGNEDDKTALHMLAEKPSAFTCRSSSRMCTVLEQSGSPARNLVMNLWNIVAASDHAGVLLTKPTHLLFDALKSGNSEFVTMLVLDHHPLLWEMDKENGNRSIIHVAVLLRQANVCKLIHEVGLIKTFLIALKDDEKNTLLHLAAQLAPKSQLNKWSGAALQMHHELKWFEAVKRIMPPSYIDMKNSAEKTAQEVFSSEHEELLKEAREWMTEAAKACMLVSTFLVSALFTTGITVALGVTTSTDHHCGENNSIDHYHRAKHSTDHHHLERATAYKIFVIADAVALFLFLIAIIMFFYILTSRYAERDFLKALPLKLIGGIIILFLSMVPMMVAFNTAFVMAYGVMNVITGTVLSCAVVAFFACAALLYPFGKEISAFTSCKSLF